MRSSTTWHGPQASGPPGMRVEHKGLSLTAPLPRAPRDREADAAHAWAAQQAARSRASSCAAPACRRAAPAHRGRQGHRAARAGRTVGLRGVASSATTSATCPPFDALDALATRAWPPCAGRGRSRRGAARADRRADVVRRRAGGASSLLAAGSGRRPAGRRASRVGGVRALATAAQPPRPASPLGPPSHRQRRGARPSAVRGDVEGVHPTGRVRRARPTARPRGSARSRPSRSLTSGPSLATRLRPSRMGFTSEHVVAAQRGATERG